MASQINHHFPDVFKEMHWIDIDEDTLLVDLYNDLIPVFKIHNEVICQHFFDEEKITLNLNN